MKNSLLKLLVTFSVLIQVGGRSLANNENTNENPLATNMTTATGSGGNTAPQIILAIQKDPKLPEEAKHVNVTYENDTIVLRGTVKTSGEKQIISGIAERSGSASIRNEIKVESLQKAKSNVSHKARVITR